MTTVFFTNVDLMLRFYAICKRCNITSEQERVNLLAKMTRKEGMSSAWNTNRTKKEIIENISQHYDNILNLTTEGQE
jgi:hypothetical protein